MSRLAVMMTLMVAVAQSLALPNFDGIEQTPMSKSGIKTATKKGGIPSKGGNQPEPPLGTCETYQVHYGTSTAARQIHDNLVIAIFPSSSFANVEVHMGDIMYMVCVEGSMVNLTKCNSDGAECEVADVNSAKRLDILTPHLWNYINITLNQTQIDVSINSKRLTAMHMEKSEENVTVLVNGEDDQVPEDYKAIIQFSCEVPATVIPVTRGPGNDTHEGTPAPQTGSGDSKDEEGGLNVGLIVGIVVAVIVVAVIAGIIYSKKVRQSADINAQTPLQQQQ